MFPRTQFCDARRVSYVGELEAALVGPRRLKRDLLQEASDHLDDATEALVRAGHAPAEARRRAEADFGPVSEIADAYAVTLAVASSRRTTGLLLGSLIGQPFLWDKGVNLAALFPGHGPAAGWIPMVDAFLEFGGSVLITGALLGVLASSVGNRWFRAGLAVARLSALFALACAAVLPLTVGGMLVGTGAGPQLWGLVALLLGGPLLLVAKSARATLAVAGQTGEPG